MKSPRKPEKDIVYDLVMAKFQAKLEDWKSRKLRRNRYRKLMKWNGGIVRDTYEGTYLAEKCGHDKETNSSDKSKIEIRPQNDANAVLSIASKESRLQLVENIALSVDLKDKDVKATVDNNSRKNSGTISTMSVEGCSSTSSVTFIYENQILLRIGSSIDDRSSTLQSSIYTMDSLNVPQHNSRRTPSFDLTLIQAAITNENQRMSILAESINAMKHCNTLSSSYERVQFETEYLKLLFFRDLLQKEPSDSLPSTPREPQNGRIKITRIELPHKVPDVSQLEHDNWFVCILQYQRNVIVTKPVLMTNEPLIFNAKYCFERVGRDFQLNVFVYCLSLRKIELMEVESENVSCPTLRSLIHSIRPSRPTTPKEVSTKSTYILHATACITASDLHATTFQLTHSSSTSPLHEYLRAVLITSCTLDHHRHGGFLNIGRTKVPQERAIFYNLFWCELRGSELLYWISPASAEQAPLGRFELKLCKIGCKVVMARPEMSARKKTLMVEAGGERWLLHSFDLRELKVWMVKINRVLDDIWLWEANNLS